MEGLPKTRSRTTVRACRCLRRLRVVTRQRSWWLLVMIFFLGTNMLNSRTWGQQAIVFSIDVPAVFHGSVTEKWFISAVEAASFEERPNSITDGHATFRQPFHLLSH